MNSERTAPVTVSAAEAGICPDGQFSVVVMRHAVACERQVVVFIDDSDVDAGGAGLAVPDVLIFGQCLPEWRGFGGEQLPAVEGLHDRYADSFRLGAAQECGTFVGGADSVFVAAFEIIGGAE